MLPLKAFIASGKYTFIGWPGISRCDCIVRRRYKEDKSVAAHLSFLSNPGSLSKQPRERDVRDKLPNDIVRRIDSIMKPISLIENAYFNEILSVLGLRLGVFVSHLPARNPLGKCKILSKDGCLGWKPPDTF